MKRNRGFTLMELLLVIAILAIVAAVAAPQFFRAGEQAMTDARVALLKANYAAIKAAVNMRVWDEKNNTKLTDKIDSKGDGLVNTDSKIKLLITKGYLQDNAAYVENAKGEKMPMGVYRAPGLTTTPSDPYDTVASSPIFMESVNVYKVYVVVNGANYSLDDNLQLNKSWNEIYANGIN